MYAHTLIPKPPPIVAPPRGPMKVSNLLSRVEPLESLVGTSSEACFGLVCVGPGSTRVSRAALGVSPRAVRMARARRPSRHARRVCSPDQRPRFLQCLGACPEDLYWFGKPRIIGRVRKTTVIVALSVVGIILNLVLRFGFHASPRAYQIPLLAALVIGGLPLLYNLLRKLLKREFGSDLLGGISVVTLVILGEYFAGSIIVLMLAVGEALESYALRIASPALAARPKRMSSVAHRKRGSEIVDVARPEVTGGDNPGGIRRHRRAERVALRLSTQSAP